MSSFDLGPSKFDELFAKSTRESDYSEDFDILGLEGLDKLSLDEAVESAIPAVRRRRKQRGGSSGSGATAGDSGVTGPGEVDPPDDDEHRDTEESDDDEDVTEVYAESLEDEVEAGQIARQEEAAAKAEAARIAAEEYAVLAKVNDDDSEFEPVIVNKPRGKRPVDFEDLVLEKSTYDMADSVKGMGIKGLPIELVDALRESIRPYGNDFAQGISAKALLSAFIVAHTGLQADFDTDTESAIRAFKMAQPALEAVEARIDDQSNEIRKIKGSMSNLRQSIEAIHTDMAAALNILAWQMADRFAKVPDAMDGASIELDHVEVTKSLQHAKSYGEAHVKQFKRDKGRPMR